MANVIQQLMVLLGCDSSGLNNTLDQTQTRVSAFSGSVTKALAGISFGAFSIGALEAANKFDQAFAQIQRSTGATGDSLKGLEQSFTNVYKNTTASAEQVTSTLSLLSTRTHLTGTDLEDLTNKAIQLAKTQKEDVATIIPAITQMFGTWSIATNRQGAAMDFLRVTSQQTGVPVSRLTEEVVAQAPALKDLGYNWQQAVALIGNFDKSGALAQGALVALKKVLGTFAKEGVQDTAAEWQKLVKGVEDGSVTFDQFIKIAGSKGGTALFDAIRSGIPDVANLDLVLQDLNKSVDESGDSVETMRGRLVKWQHQIEALIGTHKDLVIALGLGIPILTTLGGGFARLGAIALPTIANITTALRFGLGGALTAAEGFAASFAGALSGALALIGGDFLLSKAADAGTGIGSAIAKGVRLGLLVQFPNLGGLFSNSYSAASPAAPHSAVMGPNLPPGGASGTTGGGLGTDYQKAFSTLGLQDYRDELAKVTEAYNELMGAGKLTVTQQLAVQDRIISLKDAIADFRPTFLSLADARPFEGQISIIDIFAEKQKSLDAQTLDYLKAYSTSSSHADDQLAHLIASATGFDEATIRAGISAEKLSENMPRQFFGTKAYDDLSDADKALDQAGVFVQKIDTKHLQDVTDQLQAMGVFGPKIPPEIERISSALKTLGISGSRDSITGLQTALGGLNEALKTGAINQDEYNRGFVNYVDDLKKEGVQIDANTAKVYNQIKAHLEVLKTVQEYHDQAVQLFRGVVDGAEHGFADMVTSANFSLDNLSKVGQKFASDFFAMMLKSLFKPLEDAFAKLAGQIGTALGSIWSNASGPAGAAASNTTTIASSGGFYGVAPAAANTATTAAGGAASAAASSLTSVLGAIGSIGSFITGGINDIQNIHMSNLLGEIEVNTRSAFNELTNRRADAWSQFNGMYARMGDIWNSIKAISSVGSDGGLNLLVSKFDQFVIPDLGNILNLMQTSVMAGAGGGNITINQLTLQVKDPRDFMQQLSRIARSQGVLGGIPNI